ncbi:MAG TPA: GPW/gp25 family protein [Pyrinomonadaceae bacterium]|jgi:phage baseplate assembly protein W|nr:GPW/gp25 family protein [Pyrinomonadaceae bacterium]
MRKSRYRSWKFVHPDLAYTFGMWSGISEENAQKLRARFGNDEDIKKAGQYAVARLIGEKEAEKLFLLMETQELPGLNVSPTGGIEMVEEKDSVRQAIFMLLSTIPGERVMRPDYGCDLYKLIFAPNDYTTAGLAIHYVRQAIDRWERRVEILLLDAYNDRQNQEKLNIVMEYRLRATQTIDQLNFSLHLAGEQS